MTLITLARPIWYPHSPAGTALVTLTNAGTVDAAGEYSAIIFEATEAMTISHVGHRPNNITALGTLDYRIETVGADGLPTGTLWATDTNIAGGALTSGTFSLQALTASASISPGDLVCVKFAYNSGTSVQTGNVINALAPSIGSSRGWRVINTGTPTISAGNLTGVVGSSTTAFYHVPQLIPVSAETDTDFTSASSPNRYGIRFQVPFDCRIRGFSINSQQVGDFTAALYTDAGASMTTEAVDGNQFLMGSGPVCNFGSPQTLTRNTWYRATIEATSGTQELQTLTLPSVDYNEACFWGATGHLTTHDGSWNDTATDIIPIMSLLLDQIDDGTGSGAAAGTVAYTFA